MPSAPHSTQLREFPPPKTAAEFNTATVTKEPASRAEALISTGARRHETIIAGETAKTIRFAAEVPNRSESVSCSVVACLW